MRRLFHAMTCLALVSGAAATAQDREVPYWATVKTGELNMRVGPGQSYRIDWVFKRRGLPLKVVRVHEGWRRVQDPSGAEGWVSANLLSPDRSAIVQGEGLAAMRDAPADNAVLKWNAEPGVVGKLGECDGGWCEFDVGGRTGWVRETRLWGAGKP